jgi:hypothetical protein
MLGPRHPAYYPAGNERALARTLSHAEREGDYYRLILQSCAARAPLVSPERERCALAELISEVISLEQRAKWSPVNGRALLNA